MIKFFLKILFLFLFEGLMAQNKYWIYFSEKDEMKENIGLVSEKALKNRSMLKLDKVQFSDLPVHTGYIDSLKFYEVAVINKSKWLNAITATLNGDQLETLSQLGFISKITPVNKGIYLAENTWYRFSQTDYSAVLKQVNAKAFSKSNLTGKGVVIGIIDGGFYKANLNQSLRMVFEENRVLGAKDYVSPGKKDIYDEMETFMDWHGSRVWQLIGGYDYTGNDQYGMATDASFVIARTDHGKSEFRGEEDYWIAAMEWMDSLGVRLVNTSLGYSTGFDDPEENYRPEEMDGKTSAITRAAEIAATEKGMLIVVSAGNEGNDPQWKVVSTPADARHVFSIGATKKHSMEKAGYSGVGPEFLPYLKPNVACFSASGTSFSAPVITGMAACIMQMDSTLTNIAVMDIIEKASHLYPYGNNYIGYGVPDAGRALNIMLFPDDKSRRHEEVHTKAESIELKQKKYKSKSAIVFHKKDKQNVLYQDLLKSENGRIKIVKPEQAKRSTVAIGDKVIEVFWK